MRLLAIAPIAEGAEVVTSYLDLTLPELQRRKELAERYKFGCDCRACDRSRSRAGEPDPREAVACGKGCGGMSWLPGEPALSPR